MQKIELHTAQAQLPSIIHSMNDAPIVLSENGMPLAMLVPYPKPDIDKIREPGLFAGQMNMRDDFKEPLCFDDSHVKKTRKPGTAKGLLIIHDNFDDPLPGEFNDAFGL